MLIAPNPYHYLRSSFQNLHRTTDDNLVDTMIYLLLVCQRQDADIPTSFRVSFCHFRTLSFVELLVRDTMASLSTNYPGLLLCHVTNYGRGWVIND